MPGATSRRLHGLLIVQAMLFVFLSIPAFADAAGPPRPLLAAGKPVDWWFVFKFNATSPFTGCFPPVTGDRKCMFGGEPLTKPPFSQQYAVASSDNAALESGAGCLGATKTDPVGATFDQVFNGRYFYVLWNDQFYGDPVVCGRSGNCGKGWGHSKGMVAWDNKGDGFVMQVSTPSWPGSGTKRIVRRSGNTLGCLAHNNLRASQHFFALKLDKGDLLKVLRALKTANAPTKPTELQVVSNGGPDDVRSLVDELGRRPPPNEQVEIFDETLSTNVRLIAKPSRLLVPPWQMLSALLSGAAERVVTWRHSKDIPSTRAATKVGCWSPMIAGKPGKVAIALTGVWDGKPIKLTQPMNHAKIATALSNGTKYVVFSDLNQQGSIGPPKPCDSAQNARGGLFFVLEDTELYDSLGGLIDGDTEKFKKR